MLSFINRLISYFYQKQLIEKEDIPYMRNRLGYLFSVSEEELFCMELVDEEVQLHDLLQDFGFLYPDWNEKSLMEKDKLEAEIVNLFLSKPSDINRKFEELKAVDVELATDWFYQFSIATNYIKMDRIQKNIQFETPSEYGTFEITINLSKPEKDPAAIAKLKTTSSFPSCVLCEENVGYHGSEQPRANHRVIPITIGEEHFCFQYSPYVYYPEHCIVFAKDHTPMEMGDHTFERLTDFIDQFPHYFLGSNASKPYVGGSILEHEHYQGGKYHFPIEQAKILHTVIGDATYELLNWPLTTIRVVSDSKENFLRASKHLYKRWMNYESDVFDFDHNAVTLLFRKSNGVYNGYVTFRNNSTTEEYPLGMFHVKEDKHNIKKENIGLIEVAGLAILPGRLAKEMEEILAYKQGKTTILNVAELHRGWVTSMTSEIQTKEDLYQEVGLVFVRGLEDCKVMSSDSMISWMNKFI